MDYLGKPFEEKTVYTLPLEILNSILMLYEPIMELLSKEFKENFFKDFSDVKMILIKKLSLSL